MSAVLTSLNRIEFLFDFEALGFPAIRVKINVDIEAVDTWSRQRAAQLI